MDTESSNKPPRASSAWTGGLQDHKDQSAYNTGTTTPKRIVAHWLQFQDRCSFQIPIHKRCAVWQAPVSPVFMRYANQSLRALQRTDYTRCHITHPISLSVALRTIYTHDHLLHISVLIFQVYLYCVIVGDDGSPFPTGPVL